MKPSKRSKKKLDRRSLRLFAVSLGNAVHPCATFHVVARSADAAVATAKAFAGATDATSCTDLYAVEGLKQVDAIDSSA
jgi:hypothetical protein